MEVKIRNVQLSDAFDLLKIYEPYVMHTFITYEYSLPTIDEFQKRIKTISKDFPFLVATIEEKIVGYAYGNHFRERKAFDWDCELSIYVDENYQHQGIGKKLYEKLIFILRELHFHNLYALIASPNPQSEQFHVSFGFTQVGYYPQIGYKFHQWNSLTIYHKRIQDESVVLPTLSYSKWYK